MQLLASALPWQVTVSAAPVQQHNRTADERAFVVNSSAEALFFFAAIRSGRVPERVGAHCGAKMENFWLMLPC